MGSRQKIKTLIALPAYNEGKVIGRVLDEIKKEGFGQILVVDDGSFDNTAQIAKEKKVYVVSHFKNCGLGAAIRTALKFARQFNYDILVTFDADGQHDAKDLKNIIHWLNKKRAEIAIGVRNYAGTNVSRLRRFIIFLSNIYTWILVGVYSHDSQSGFRAFSKRAINAIDLKTERMEVSSEIFFEIAKKKLRFVEVPVSVKYTAYSLKKGQRNMNMFNVGFKLLLKLFS